MHVKIKRLKIKGLFNTRDLGGLPTQDGKKIKYGKLIRSGKLYKLPKKSVAKLEAMGIDTVIDMRIPAEREEKPDVPIAGARYLTLPVITTATVGITHEKSLLKLMITESKRIKKEFGTAHNYMAATYRAILMNDEPRESLKKIMREIADAEGCILWHCSGGKDRAGIVAMLVESILGVSEEVILQDFTASLRFQHGKHFWNRFGLVFAPISLRLKKILWVMMAAKKRYLLDVMREIEGTYGSIPEFCKQVLSLTDEDMQKMRDKYLED